MTVVFFAQFWDEDDFGKSPDSGDVGKCYTSCKEQPQTVNDAWGEVLKSDRSDAIQPGRLEGREKAMARRILAEESHGGVAP